MIFDAHTPPIRPRSHRPHGIGDQSFLPPTLAMTGTDMWIDPAPPPRRRPRWQPPSEQALAFAVPTPIAVTPSTMWIEQPAPLRRRRIARLPLTAARESWGFPSPVPPNPPPPPPPVSQTLYALISSPSQATFSGQPAFQGLPAGQPLYVGNMLGQAVPARPGVTIAIVFNIAAVIGMTRYITNASVFLTEISGADAVPGERMLGGATVVQSQGRVRSAVHQILFGLVPNGEYVALVSAGTTDGSRFNFSAPFSVAPF